MFQIKGGPKVRLGRRIPTETPDAVPLGKFYSIARANGPLPMELDLTPKAANSLGRMYANNQLGNCVIAGRFHNLGVWSANDRDAEKEILATDTEAASEYRTICGPGDHGCFINQVLDVMLSRGLTAGGTRRTLDGYCSVDMKNEQLIRAALYVFGGLALGINVPKAWMDVRDGGVWDVSNTPRIGGHDVAVIGYHPNGVVVSTWGGIRTITWRALGDSSICDECYALLGPDWYNSDRVTPTGFDRTALQAAMIELQGGRPPNVDPPVPPVPPVPVPVDPWTWPVAEIDVDFKPANASGVGTGNYKGTVKLAGPVPPGCGCGQLLGARGNWMDIIALLIELAPIIIAWINSRKSTSELKALIERHLKG